MQQPKHANTYNFVEAKLLSELSRKPPYTCPAVPISPALSNPFRLELSVGAGQIKTI